MHTRRGALHARWCSAGIACMCRSRWACATACTAACLTPSPVRTRGVVHCMHAHAAWCTACALVQCWHCMHVSIKMGVRYRLHGRVLDSVPGPHTWRGALHACTRGVVHCMRVGAVLALHACVDQDGRALPLARPRA